MRLKRQFSKARERQVVEAVTIMIEQRKGIHLLNSKSEFNRPTLPRLTAGNQGEGYEMMKEDKEIEKQIKSDIKSLKKRNKNKSIVEDNKADTYRRE